MSNKLVEAVTPVNDNAPAEAMPSAPISGKVVSAPLADTNVVPIKPDPRTPVRVLLKDEAFAAVKSLQDHYRSLVSEYNPKLAAANAQAQAIMEKAQQDCAALAKAIDEECTKHLQKASSAIWAKIYELTGTAETIPLLLNTNFEEQGLYILEETNPQLNQNPR